MNSSNTKKLLTVVVVIILLVAGLAMWPRPVMKKVRAYNPTVDLPEDYYLFVDLPQSVEDYTFIAMLSCLAVRGTTYHPMFIVGNMTMDQHQQFTFNSLKNNKAPAIVFSHDGTAGQLATQNVTVQEDMIFTIGRELLAQFKGFDDLITVATYEEALWVAPLAKAKNLVMINVPDEPSYGSQEEVWDELLALGLRADYIVVVNPNDYDNVLLATTGVNETEVKFNVQGLSAIAAELAAYRDAYVLTRWDPNRTEVGYMDLDLNARAIGLLMKLRQTNITYGPFEYIGIVGSAPAVPQFILPDDTDPTTFEPDGVDCDVMYGYLDEEKYVMDAAVGRIINLNVQGVSNQMIRTFLYDSIVDEVEVDFSRTGGGLQTVNWRAHGSIWNGFEVADQRLQMSPGWFLHKDFPDEGMTYDYVRTTGNEGVREVGTGKEVEMEPIMESSSIVAYRGHGSWHATFYVYEPDDPSTLKGRLEGYDASGVSPSVRNFDLPPQVAILVSCENGKIRGQHFSAADIDMERTFSYNYFYGGAVGLIGASEVSFSNVGQDFSTFPEDILPGIFFKRWSDGDYEWDLNNMWFAAGIDGLINHEEEHGTIGKAVQWGENRYIKTHDSQISPFDHGTTPDWKEIAMYVCLGDPAFKPTSQKPGANSYDPWHNGPTDM